MRPEYLDRVHSAHEHLIARMQTSLLKKATPEFVRGLGLRAVVTDPRYRTLYPDGGAPPTLTVEYCLACAEQRIKDNLPVQYPPDM